jgi:hypothetical protein
LPFAPVGALRADVVVVADDRIALVLLQQLVGDHRVAGLGARIDAVEHLRLLFQVIARALEVLVPVGILDDHPDLGIDRLGRAEHQVLADLAHGLQPILAPGAITLGGDVGRAFRRIEEEVVEDHLVEMLGGQAHGLLAFGPVGGLFVVEGAELAALAAGRQGDPAGHGDAAFLEPALDLFDLRVAGEVVVAIDLQIDLVEMQLPAGALELRVEHGLVGQGLGVVDGDIDGGVEILVGRQGLGLDALGMGGGRDDGAQRRGAEQTAG